ncbi:MAG: peptidylprolyl isomerase [Planctomycetota bacterium]
MTRGPERLTESLALAALLALGGCASTPQSETPPVENGTIRNAPDPANRDVSDDRSDSSSNGNASTAAELIRERVINPEPPQQIAAAPDADLRAPQREPELTAPLTQAQPQGARAPETDTVAAPPVGAWNRGDAVAAIVADRAILESDVYVLASALYGGDREPTLRERQGVLLQMVQEELLLHFTLQQHGERALEFAEQIASDRRAEQIREVGFLRFHELTEAGGSSVKADFEARKKEILLTLGRQYIQQQHFGEYRHLQVSPKEICEFYETNFEEEFAAKPPLVQVEIAQFKLEDANEDEHVQEFAKRWREDSDAAKKADLKPATMSLDFGDEPSWPEWLGAFAEEAQIGEVSDPMVGSRAVYRHVVRVTGRTEEPFRDLEDPEVQEGIRNHLLVQRLERVVQEGLLESLPQIPIWPPEVKRQVRLVLSR